MREQRRHGRTLFSSQVKITHASFGAMILTSRDVSDGGLFLLTEGRQMPSVGSVVEVQALVFGETAPVLKAKIVRQTDDGIGLMFEIT